MNGDPYRQSAEPVDEVYDDFEPFRRALARQRQWAFLIAGYAFISVVNVIAQPSWYTITAIVAFPLPSIAALWLRDVLVRRDAP